MNRNQRRTLISKLRKKAFSQDGLDKKQISSLASTYGEQVYNNIINNITIPGLDEGLQELMSALDTASNIEAPSQTPIDFDFSKDFIETEHNQDLELDIDYPSNDVEDKAASRKERLMKLGLKFD